MVSAALLLFIIVLSVSYIVFSVLKTLDIQAEQASIGQKFGCYKEW